MKSLMTLLAMVTAVGVQAPLPAVEAAESAARLQWRPCHPEAGPSLECATIRVPLDHDRPRGPKIELAVIRLPASDPERKIGSLFLNPGGPGTSGVGMVLDAAAEGAVTFSDEVRARFDLVGFDPRGIHAEHAAALFRARWRTPSTSFRRFLSR